MGKNANQIATYEDLNSIGYRIPALKKAITLSDLKTINKNIDEVSVNDTLNYIHTNCIPIINVADNKCIKWEDIPGTQGQDNFGTTNMDGVRVPILCKVSEDILGSIDGVGVRFNYKYKLVGDSATYTKVVGRVAWSDNISGSVSKICWVLINPNPNLNLGNVEIQYDYLEIECGDTTFNRDWEVYIRTPENSEWNAVDYNASSKNCKYQPEEHHPFGCLYTKGLNRLTGIHFKVV